LWAPGARDAWTATCYEEIDAENDAEIDEDIERRPR
jgi:hypothetical protein